MRDKAKALNLLSTLALLAALSSCMADTEHISITFVPVEAKGWEHTDTLGYTMPPLKNADSCEISLLLHTEGYIYENIAFDITIYQDSILLYHEQRDYLLCDNLKAEGFGRRCDYKLPVGNFTLCDTLPTTIALMHRIDRPVLKGIREVGIYASTPIGQSGEVVWEVDWNK